MGKKKICMIEKAGKREELETRAAVREAVCFAFLKEAERLSSVDAGKQKQ